MRRIWFKSVFREPILKGAKTATTRDHQKDLGKWLAVTGPYQYMEDFRRFLHDSGLQRYARSPVLFYW